MPNTTRHTSCSGLVRERCQLWCPAVAGLQLPPHGPDSKSSTALVTGIPSTRRASLARVADTDGLFVRALLRLHPAYRVQQGVAGTTFRQRDANRSSARCRCDPGLMVAHGDLYRVGE